MRRTRDQTPWGGERPLRPRLHHAPCLLLIGCVRAGDVPPQPTLAPHSAILHVVRATAVCPSASEPISVRVDIQNRDPGEVTFTCDFTAAGLSGALPGASPLGPAKAIGAWAHCPRTDGSSGPVGEPQHLRAGATFSVVVAAPADNPWSSDLSEFLSGSLQVFVSATGVAEWETLFFRADVSMC